MLTVIAQFHAGLERRARQFGIAVQQAELPEDVPGKFDGPTITLNKHYDATELAFYLAHSIGSIAEWNLQEEPSNRVMQELRQAKRARTADKARFERALDAYLAFETRTWERAVWLVRDSGYAALIDDFSNFGRADLDSMRIFHATGKAPVWRDFFAAWCEQVRRGEKTVTSFAERPIPDFHARKIPEQEIVQEDDDAPE
jgi:hypothetical protein